MRARVTSRRLRVGRVGTVGLVLLGALAVVAAAAPLLAPHDPRARVGVPFARPDGRHLLGTNDVGQDLLSELIYGARVSLVVGLAAAAMATTVGATVGLVAGYSRGWVDTVLMRIVDVVLSLPFLPLAIVVGVFLGPGIPTLIGLIAAVTWAGTARELRAQVLSARELDYVCAARAMGGNTAHVLGRHVLAEVAPLVVPQFVMAAKVAILAEASLSFLGLGDPSTRSWGATLSAAHARSAFLTDAWIWWVVPPGLCIGLTVVAFALVGYGFEEAARPRLRRRRPQRAAMPTPTPAPAAAVGQRVDATDVPVLAAECLSVRYDGPDGGVLAVEGVSFSVGQGEVVGLIGESGSGKSSVVSAAVGLLRPPAALSGGRVLLDGDDLAGLSVAVLRRRRSTGVALVPQQAMSAHKPVRRVGDQLAEAVRAHRPASRAEARARGREVLGMVGIDPGRARDYPHQFSGGMRQRVVIAMALVNEPRLLIADEPTTGLDLVTAAEVLDLLAELQRRLGMAMLVVSHDLAAVLGIASRVVVMAGWPDRGAGPGRPGGCGPVPSPHPPAARCRSPAPGRHRGRERSHVNRRPTPPLLELREVSRTFRRTGVLAVDRIRLEVARGEAVGLVGASGAGKSTVARLVAGLEVPDSGTIAVDGVDIGGLGRRARRRLRQRVHMVFQDPYASLAPHMRVADTVAEPLVIGGAEDAGARRRLVADALDAVCLDPSRYLERWPHELSGGERQRVALARAIVGRPELIVADEPTGMLDPRVRAELLVLMKSLQRRHRLAWLFITHDLAVADGFCDRLVVMADGAVVEAGATAEVVGAPSHPATVALVSAARRLQSAVGG